MNLNQNDPVVKKHRFLRRMILNLTIGFGIIVLSLLIGMEGYHHFEKMNWIDSYANAAMILSGMGPMGNLNTDAGKIFAGTYALFSGIVFLALIAIIFAPIFHHFFYTVHLEQTKKEVDK